MQRLPATGGTGFLPEDAGYWRIQETRPQTPMPCGGHFAMQVPDVYVGEVRRFFRDYR